MKKSILKLSIVFIFSSILVIILYGVSDKLTHERNNFHRFFTPHTVIPVKGVDLRYNSYYFSGADDQEVYLGNITAPLHMLKVCLPSMDTIAIQLTVEKTAGLKLRKNSSVMVHKPYLYIFDGVTPKILRGDLKTYRVKAFMCDSAYFSNAIPIGPKSLAIRSLSSASGEYVLGKLTDSFPCVRLVPGLLEKQFDGIFCTDGMLHYNKELSRLIYLYYYRNQYMVLDTTLNVVYKGRTIDTNSIAKISTAVIKSDNTKTLASPPLMVNKKSRTLGNLLLVLSNLMAKNEDPKTFKATSVIDVYDLKKGSYEFSFYIDPYMDIKLTDFYLTETHLITMHHRYLVLYELSPTVFETLILPDETDTFRSQEKQKAKISPP